MKSGKGNGLGHCRKSRAACTVVVLERVRYLSEVATTVRMKIQKGDVSGNKTDGELNE